MNPELRSANIFGLCVLFLLPAAESTPAQNTGAKKAAACIEILQVVPEIKHVSDSGETIEPAKVVIKAHGRPEDLESGAITYSEDGTGLKVIPVGDLKPGVQVLSIQANLHESSSTEMFTFYLISPGGSSTPGISDFLHRVGYVQPDRTPERELNDKKQEDMVEKEDSDQPIESIEAGVDPAEVESIRQFPAGKVAITSFDGTVDLTEGDESRQTPQIILVHGVNFKDGLEVRFTSFKGGETVEATSALSKTRVLGKLRTPGWYKPDNPSTLYSAEVVVPSIITHKVTGDFTIRTVHGNSMSDCN